MSDHFEVKKIERKVASKSGARRMIGFSKENAMKKLAEDARKRVVSKIMDDHYQTQKLISNQKKKLIYERERSEEMV